jgi:hypothetical protein
MVARLFGVLAAFVLQVACVERTLDGEPPPFDPEADDRTNAEILHDFCKTFVACKIDAPVLDMPTCSWWFDWVNTNFEMSTVAPPECAVALWDQLACVSEEDSCEDFRGAWITNQPWSNHRCDEPFDRFADLRCGSAENTATTAEQ